MPDPFQNTAGIPVGQNPENLALNVSRSGACVSGGFRSGFIATPGEMPDLHTIGAAGTVTGGDYAWRDRALPPASPINQAPTISAPVIQ